MTICDKIQNIGNTLESNLNDRGVSCTFGTGTGEQTIYDMAKLITEQNKEYIVRTYDIVEILVNAVKTGYEEANSRVYGVITKQRKTFNVGFFIWLPITLIAIAFILITKPNFLTLIRSSAKVSKFNSFIQFSFGINL